MMLTAMIAAMALQAAPFEFRGETTPVAVDLTTKQNCEAIEGLTYCTQSADVAGVRSIFTASYNEGRLNSLLGQFDGESYLTMLNAFTAKYGTPVLSTKEWRNRAGTVLTNDVATWEFIDGTMVLESIGSRVTNGAFRFTSTTNQPPVAAPVVDF